MLQDAGATLLSHRLSETEGHKRLGEPDYPSPELSRTELPLRALRAEHGQLASDVTVGTPLVCRVLVLTRYPATLGAGQRVLVGLPHAEARLPLHQIDGSPVRVSGT
jgi:hypothetical protein